jgi:hypothetical protein
MINGIYCRLVLEAKPVLSMAIKKEQEVSVSDRFSSKQVENKVHSTLVQ